MLSLQSLQREGRSAEVDAVTDEPFLVVPCGIFFLLFFFFSFLRPRNEVSDRVQFYRGFVMSAVSSLFSPPTFFLPCCNRNSLTLSGGDELPPFEGYIPSSLIFFFFFKW